MPPQPTLDTFTTFCAVRLMPGLSTVAGMGRAPGSVGSRPAKTGGNWTPARTCWTLARNGGGLGANVARACRTVERWICWAISGLGPREKLRPRNQHITRTANAERAAQATESVEVWMPVRRI